MNVITPVRISLAVLLLLLPALPVEAQQDMLPGDSQSVGMIKGTDMQKSEFRARAYTQMLAAAVNAHAYYLEYNEYPEDFYALYNSGAWNLDLLNIFTGVEVDAVFYDPESVGKTNLPSTGLMSEMRPLDTTLQILPPSGPSDPDNPVIQPLNMSSSPLRVDPQDVTSPTPGDVLYYSNGKLLQLVIYAPDGTYVEYVQNSPDQRWLSTMSVSAAEYEWPWDVYAAQVLLFSEEMLPQYYSLYRYMSDQEDIPRHRLATYSAQQRIDMALELGIVIWNPFSKSPIKAGEVPVRGDFLMETGAPPTPLVITLNGDRLFTLADAVDTVGSAPGSNNPIYGVPGQGSKDREKPRRKSKHGSFGSR